MLDKIKGMRETVFVVFISIGTIIISIAGFLLIVLLWIVVSAASIAIPVAICVFVAKMVWNWG